LKKKNRPRLDERWIPCVFSAESPATARKMKNKKAKVAYPWISVRRVLLPAFGAFWLQEPASFLVAEAKMALLQSIIPFFRRNHKEIFESEKNILHSFLGPDIFLISIQETSRL